MAAIVHLAGADVEANGRLRQRCSWCGAVLFDYDLTSIARPIEPGESEDADWRPAVWAVGDFVRIDSSGGATISEAVAPEPHPENADRIKIPEGACMDLDPEMTA